MMLHTWFHISASGHSLSLGIFFPKKGGPHTKGCFVHLGCISFLGHRPIVLAEITSLKRLLGLARLQSPWVWAVLLGMSLPEGAELQGGNRGQIFLKYIYIYMGFFNVTTALIILHTNPIPGTNLLSQSSYFFSVHILTFIKFSVCPKLTNTAHCFIQWRQSINKAQLLSLPALLHFQITINYVDAGAVCLTRA